MHKCKANGLTIYENLTEMLNGPILFISEYDGFYYVRMKPEEFYDNGMYKVNKQTGEVSLMYFTEYLIEGLMDKAKEIDPATLRRGA
ncbi:hypothetical protein D1159_05650 [Pseudoflavonifractor sp. 524-17]|uniref:hypothetical protein n=1 Tax=Pseudoflavonifractor sp. 524-17 TaxID=2304577 RepID=UPI00137B5306|nr:hypothetical protein [Pseudoflavonifractor sp. 524-17]NCE64082.1 hypothetical protein [Pseudoflavonifractor sp. 524-17]